VGSEGDGMDEDGVSHPRPVDTSALDLKVIPANDDELNAHAAFIEMLDKKSGGQCLWKQLDNQ